MISVCLYPGNMQMILETTYSSQTKLIGQSLPIGEHGIGYSKLAYAADKGKRGFMADEGHKGQYLVLAT